MQKKNTERKKMKHSDSIVVDDINKDDGSFMRVHISSFIGHLTTSLFSLRLFCYMFFFIIVTESKKMFDIYSPYVTINFEYENA